MKRPSKLMLKLARSIKPESPARMRARVKSAIRQYNNEGISTNWAYQAEVKL